MKWLFGFSVATNLFLGAVLTYLYNDAQKQNDPRKNWIYVDLVQRHNMHIQEIENAHLENISNMRDQLSAKQKLMVEQQSNLAKLTEYFYLVEKKLDVIPQLEREVAFWKSAKRDAERELEIYKHQIKCKVMSGTIYCLDLYE